MKNAHQNIQLLSNMQLYKDFENNICRAIECYRSRKNKLQYGEPLYVVYALV